MWRLRRARATNPSSTQSAIQRLAWPPIKASCQISTAMRSSGKRSARPWLRSARRPSARLIRRSRLARLQGAKPEPCSSLSGKLRFTRGTRRKGLSGNLSAIGAELTAISKARRTAIPRSTASVCVCAIALAFWMLQRWVRSSSKARMPRSFST